MTALAAQVAPLDLGGFDKLQHFGASLVVTDAAWAGAAALDAPLWGRALFAVGAGVAVGVGKELYDATGGGTPDVADLIYDGLGIGAGVGFALAAEAIVRRATLDEPPPARAQAR